MTTEPGAATPTWPARLLAAIDESDRRARGLVNGLSDEQLNWQPAPGAWSIGQCLDHLFTTNEVYLPAIAASLQGKPAGMAQEITPGWFGRWFIRSYIAPSPQSKKAKAPDKIAPHSRVDLSILDAFLRSNDTLRELVRQASGYDVNRIRFRNPLIPVIRFTAGTGLEIVTKHQSRHLLQAERVRQSPGFPKMMA